MVTLSKEYGPYHRRVGQKEQDLVKASGEVWGKAPRQIAGNGDACVKAFLGPLPPDIAGYSFKTSIAPSAERNFMGGRGVVWTEDDDGVIDVPGHPGYVSIEVELV